MLLIQIHIKVHIHKCISFVKIYHKNSIKFYNKHFCIKIKIIKL